MSDQVKKEALAFSVSRIMQLIARQQEEIVTLTRRSLVLSESMLRVGLRMERLERMLTLVGGDTEKRQNFEGVKA